MEKVQWVHLNHEVPPGWEKYVTLLCEACSAKNEAMLVARFQKVVRLIYDEQTKEPDLDAPTVGEIVANTGGWKAE